MAVSRKVQLHVRDLRRHLVRYERSPEEFARTAQLSHMTIRRWLKKGDHEQLPSKYVPTLGPLFGKAHKPVLFKKSLARALRTLSTDALMAEIEKAGMRLSEFRETEAALEKKLKNFSPDEALQHCCDELLKAVKSSESVPRAKMIAAGALLYFADPQKGPDDSALIGYLGELAILSIALNKVYSLRL